MGVENLKCKNNMSIYKLSTLDMLRRGQMHLMTHQEEDGQFHGNSLWNRYGTTYAFSTFCQWPVIETSQVLHMLISVD